MSSFSSTKSIISYAAKSYGFDIKLLEAHLQNSWADVVGNTLASHTWPDSIKFRKLILLAENSAWLQQLVFLKPTILQKVNVFAQENAITDIVLRIGNIALYSSMTRHIPRVENYSVVPMKSAVELANSWAAEIKEPELREILVEVVSKGLSLGKHMPDPQTR